MGYIDIFIPFALGLLFLTLPAEQLIKPTSANFEKKKSVIRKIGWVMIGVSLLYWLIKLMS